jgi:cardiolipin synthase
MITVVLAVQVSCTGTSSGIRMEQASDGLTSGGNLAMVAVRATALAAVRQPVTTTKLGLAVLWHRPREVVGANLPVSLKANSVSREAPGTAAFEESLDRMNAPAAETGKLRWLVDGPAFFQELDHRIETARHSIKLQVFIFDNDDIGVRYADRLKRRSSEIPVHVLFDDLGNTLAHLAAPKTSGPPGFVPIPNMAAYLRKDSATGARRTLSPWLACDHTKLIVFDQQVAIVGGMNIGREYYSEWHDLMVRVEGPIVRSLVTEFDRAWRRAGPWGDFARCSVTPPEGPSTNPITGAYPLRILRTDPAEGRYEILDATLLAIHGARKRVWIQNPYFAHDDLVLAAASAARRGVDVRVIMPQGADSTLMDAGNLSTARTLIHAGAKVFKYPRMTHLKAMICDEWASVGSANFDTLSMRINRELNLSFHDRSVIRELEQAVFLPDFRRSARILRNETNGLANSVAETIADQF